MKLPTQIRQRIRIPANPDACWNWIGSLNICGYGRMWQKHLDTTAYAHRIVYEMLVGPIQKPLTIDHLCKNKRCVNPKHLEPVPIRVNILRSNGPAALNARKKFCKAGHPLSGENIYWRGPRKRSRSCRICFYAACARWAKKNKKRVKAWKRAWRRRNKLVVVSAHGDRSPSTPANRTRTRT
jgi:HNH endonuclease